MSSTVELVSGQRLLETAFRAYKEKCCNGLASREEFTESYNKFFSPLPNAIHGKPFERFSLMDPTIRTFIASTTDPTI